MYFAKLLGKRLSARAVFFSFFIVSQIASAVAANISILVIETGLPEGKTIRSVTTAWESGIMDVFFEAGHIVSNAPIMHIVERPESSFPEENSAAIQQAYAGGAEYLVIAILDYEGVTKPARPRVVSLRLFHLYPYKLLFEEIYSNSGQTPMSEEISHAKRTAQMIIPHIGDHL